MEAKDVRSVVKRHAFGVRSGVHNCICWLDESTLMYPVGKTIVLHHVATNSQRFLDASPQSTAVTALAVSANKKFVAVAEAGAVPQIQIIDTMTRKRRKVLSVAELGSDRFVAMAFSADGRHLVTQGGAPSWTMYYWNWERSKPLASTSMVAAAAAAAAAAATTTTSAGSGGYAAAHRVPAASTLAAATGGGGGGGGRANNSNSNSLVGGSVSLTHGPRSLAATSLVRTVGVCPKDPLLLSVSGVGFMRLYRYTDGVLQPQPSCGIPREHVEVFTTHAWLDGERVVAATRRASQLVLLTRGCYTHTLQVAPVVVTSSSTAAAATAAPLAPVHAAATSSSSSSSSQHSNHGSGSHATLTAANNTTTTTTTTMTTTRLATVTSIAPTHAGFVAATDHGSVCVYERVDDDDDAIADHGSYRLLHTLYVPAYEAGQQMQLVDGVDVTKTAATTAATATTTAVAAAPPIAHDTTSHGTAHASAATSNEASMMAVGGGGTSGNGSTCSTSTTAPSLAATVAGAGSGVASVSATVTLPPHAAFVLDTNSSSSSSSGTQLGVASSSSASHVSKQQAQQSSSQQQPHRSPSLPQRPLARDGETAAAAHAPRRLSLSFGSQQQQQMWHCANAVTCVALDQFEERLAVVTVCGRIYGLDFRQNWARLAEAAAEMGVTALPYSNISDAGAVTPTSSSLSAAAATQTITGAAAAAAAAATSSSSRHRGADVSVGALPHFEPICQPFHTGKINGLSCAVRKPLLLTSSVDHSVRVWNVQTCRQEICVYYTLEPGAVALHPGGLMAVVCFADRVRVMSVLWATLHDRCAISFRGAQDVRFASGGQYFAIAHGNVIDVFASSTCELHGQLRGHPQRVRDMTWCSTSPYPTDNRMVTCSTDGLVMNWDMAGMHKDAEHCDKRYQYIAVASDDRFVWAVATPTSATALDVQWKALLREMDRHSLSALQQQQQSHYPSGGGGGARTAATTMTTTAISGSSNNACEDYEFLDVGLSTLAVASHQRLLLAGSEDGALRAMSLPLQAGGTHEPPLAAHAADITRIVVSFDETTLFTASSDGSLIIWDIREDASHHHTSNAATAVAAAANSNMGVAARGRGGGGAAGGGATTATCYTDEVLVTTQEMEERRLEVDSLQQLLEKLKTELDSEEKRRNHEQSTRVRERAEEHQSDAATVAAEYAALWNATAEQQRSFAAMRSSAAAAAARATEQLERTRQREVQALEHECATLQQTLEGDQLRLAAELRDSAASATRARAAAEARFADVYAQRKEALEKLQRQVARARLTNAETVSQLEADMDAETLAMASAQQRELQQLRERYLRMKGEGAIARKNAAAMAREADVRAGEVALLERAKAALREQLTQLTQRASQLHADMAERDAVIAGKERRLHALQRQKQELEKHKFVLDHRIRQLKAQTEPKQCEVADYHARLQTKDDALAALHHRNLALRRDVAALHDELAAQQQRTRQLGKSIKDTDTYTSRWQRDVAELAPAMQEPAQLRRALVTLYERHVVARGGVRVARADAHIRDELAQQRAHLAASVQALQRKVDADARMHKAEMSTRMLENLALIGEIHELRQDMAQLRTQLASDDAAARRTRGRTGGSYSRSSSSGVVVDGGGTRLVDGAANNNNNNNTAAAATAGGGKCASHRDSRSHSSSSTAAGEGRGGGGGGGGGVSNRSHSSETTTAAAAASSPSSSSSYSTTALVGRVGVPHALHGGDDKGDDDTSSNSSGGGGDRRSRSSSPRDAACVTTRSRRRHVSDDAVAAAAGDGGKHTHAPSQCRHQQQQRRSRASRSMTTTTTELSMMATTATAAAVASSTAAAAAAPRVLDRNRAQLRVQRAYVHALEKALAEATQRPSSMPPRLPALPASARIAP